MTTEIIALIKVLFTTIGSLKASRIVAEVAAYGIAKDDAYGAAVSLGQYGWEMELLESSGAFGDELTESDGYASAPDKVILNKDTKTATFIWL